VIFKLYRLISIISIAIFGLFSTPYAFAQVQAKEAIAVSSSTAAAALPAATAQNGSDSSDNPYGIGALWRTSDLITKTVLFLLCIMSIGSWYLLVVKLLEQSKMIRQGRKVSKEFWAAPTVEKGISMLDGDCAYLFIAKNGVDANKRHSGLMGQIPLADWINMSISRSVEKVNGRMQSGLAFLATVGSTSPFVGLFGTVWGIYHALTAIGISGQASIDKVAGPVGEALIMTAIGLAVAVPAVLSYNWLVRRNKGIMDDVRSFGSDLYSVLLSTSSKV
jgi:biopolymer transport protein ExbB